MPQLNPNQVTDAETADSRWYWLYKVGGAAALITAVLIPLDVIVYIVSPPPNTVIGFFNLFQDNRLLGLLSLDLLYLVENVLMIPSRVQATADSRA